MITFPDSWLAGYDAISDGIAAFHSALPEETHDTISRNIEATIADSSNLTPILEEGSPLHFYYALLRRVFDLHDTFQTMAEIDELHRRKVSLPKTVSNNRFRKILHEVQLEEIYIFSNRCDILITFLIREFAKDAVFSDGRIAAKHLQKQIKERFAQITSIRGTHTHRFRVSNISEEFTRLTFLEDISNSSSPLPQLAALKEARKRYRTASRGLTRDIVQNAKGVLNGIGDLLLVFVYSDIGIFAVPSKYNKT